MPRPVRDRLAITYGFWTVAFIATIAVCGWKFGWLPVELRSPETGTLASPENSDPMPELPMPPASAAPVATAATETLPWTSQGEPAVETSRDRQPLTLPTHPFPAAADARSPFGGEPSIDAPPSRDRRSSAAPFNPRGSSPAEPYDEAGIPDSSDPASTDVTIIRPDRSRRVPVDPLVGALPGATPQRLPPRAAANAIDSFPPAPRNRDILLTGGEEPAAEPTVRAAAIASDDPRIAEIDRLLTAGERLPAHKEMSKLYWKEADLRPALQERIDENAKVIYFTPQPHFMDAYTVQPDDQLSMIARHYSVPWQYLARLNHADPKKIRPGQRLKVIKGPFAALIDLSDFGLIVHAHGYYVKRYPIGIGKDDSTPTGKFAVKDKLVNPTYYGPNGLVIDKDDPANPLGERWIDLGDSYGIHGTIRPDSIGKAESKGCVRLLNADVEELFDLLDRGSEVIIRR